MTAALGEAAAAGEGSAAAGASKAASKAKAPKPRKVPPGGYQSAPSASAPVGTAASASGEAGSTPRTQTQLKPKKATPAAKKTGGRFGKPTRKQKLIAAGTTGLGVKSAFDLGKPSSGRMSRQGARQILVLEFVACVVIVALSPLTQKHKQDTPGQWMKRATGVSALFVILGLIAAGGKNAAKIAAGFGGLVLVVLLLTDRDIFVTIANRFGAVSGDGPEGPGGTGSQEPAEQATTTGAVIGTVTGAERRVTASGG